MAKLAAEYDDIGRAVALDGRTFVVSAQGVLISAVLH